MKIYIRWPFYCSNSYYRLSLIGFLSLSYGEERFYKYFIDIAMYQIYIYLKLLLYTFFSQHKWYLRFSQSKIDLSIFILCLSVFLTTANSNMCTNLRLHNRLWLCRFWGWKWCPCILCTRFSLTSARESIGLYVTTVHTSSSYSFFAFSSSSPLLWIYSDFFIISLSLMNFVLNIRILSTHIYVWIYYPSAWAINHRNGEPINHRN